MRIPFKDRALEMGLICREEKGLYSYIDRYSEVVYRQLISGSSQDADYHPTDNQKTPIIAIYTKALNSQQDYIYAGCVSDYYQFIGNDKLNNNIRQSLLEVGMPILIENIFLSQNYTIMRNEIIIQSSQQVPIAGDVLPVMIVNNSYNGTKSASVSFGICTYYNRERLIFSFNLGEMKQIHRINSNTQLISGATQFIDIFTTNIAEMITSSFESKLTETEMFATLDLIENIGKRKRDEVSKLLEEMKEEGGQLPSAWQMFLAIVRYSSFEPNLNVKKMLESAAETVLVIPPRMFEVLKRLENQSSEE